MTRHWFASSLILSSLVISPSFGQVYSDFGANDERVSQMRPGFQHQNVDPAAARGRIVVAPAPVQLVDDSEGTTKSFLPKWLDWRKNKTEPKAEPKVTPKRTNTGKPKNQSQANGSNSAEPLPPDPSSMQNASLPGLGGTPLPRTSRPSATSAGATTAKPQASTPATQSQVTQSKQQSSKPSTPNLSGMRMAAREPAAASSSATSSNSEPPTTRSSPAHRTAPNISPEELRRELSGTFPTATTNEGNTGNSKPTDTIADTAASTDKSSGVSETSTTGAEAESSNSPIALPTMSPSADKSPASTKASVPALDSTMDKSAAPPNNTSSGSSVSARHSNSAYSKNNSTRVPTVNKATPQTSRGKEVFGDATTSNDPSVLASNQTPVLNVDIRGPKQILVGRESLYRVRLQNQSDVPADGVVATVRIPSGAEVVNTSATQGSVQAGRDPQSAGQLQWHLAHLDRRAGETLEVRLIPRESKPLELGVSWTLAPVGSRAVVEVQEAKLNLEIAGPNEVLFNKPQKFKLTLSNPGTGAAENIKIDLVPPGGGADKVISHPLGSLAAGASQTVEVELTARDAGKMAIKAVASADGGLKSESAKEVFCRKPELALDWRGPATKFAGTMATYFIRVRNPGTAPTDSVTVRATLPEGAEFTSASEGQTYDAAHREVAWRIGTLNPGDDNYMELKCVLKSAGKNTLNVSATSATGDLTDKKVAETNVVAIADLKLDVTDPSGPVAIGTQAVYEIHVRNRGANAAKDINVVALFSEGIEPEQADGGSSTVADGRVTFKPIDELPAGREVVLKIRAHAVQPGTHVFRAEVVCRDLDTKLVSEETTRFYADDVSPNEGAQKGESASRSNAFGPAIK